MNKLLLLDGHSILNRAFYGLPDLTNQKGQHTNAVLGFLNILLKLMDEEHPTHILVAFDVHQPTFRHLMYQEYKGTRKGMPAELREQVPLMKEVLHAMGIVTVEKGGYEADDIIGTLSRTADASGYQVTIVSGDRDLLQLATDRILVRIPKTKPSGTVIEDYYAKDVRDRYQVTPTEFIDLKGLMGDSSDNIKGVPGIGEKTATKIITEYHSIENAFAHIDEIKPAKAQNNLREYYDQAVFSKQLATIKLDCDLDVTPDDAKIQNLFTKDAYTMFKALEFKQLLKHFESSDKQTEELVYTLVTDWNEAMNINNDLMQWEGVLGLYLHVENNTVMAMSVSNARQHYVFVPKGFLTNQYLLDMAGQLLDRPMSGEAAYHTAVMDAKGLLHAVHAPRTAQYRLFDASVAAYLLNPLKQTYYYDDICRDYMGQLVPSKEELLHKQSVTALTDTEPDFLTYMAYQAFVPVSAMDSLIDQLERSEMRSLYETIELPCVYTLYHMECAGVRVDRQALITYGQMLEQEIALLRQRIFTACGEEFNILSPKQLGHILFEKMEIPGGKKTKTGYSTSADVLDKLRADYPVVQDILDYRTYSKLKSTYADGLESYICEDGRIHGTFNQTITATGRISSTEPNLQNIPMRLDVGRQIRKAFVPDPGYIYVDADYSQIELRVMAHMSGDETLVHAYQNDLDIHASTASEVFDVPIAEVTPLQRRHAKVVNFGIIYGQSAFGLSQELGISRKEASDYIAKYFKTYPKVDAFLKKSVEDAKETGYAVTLWNRRRPVPELASNNFMQKSFGERAAMNSPIQGSAADIIKIAMVLVDQELIRQGLHSRLVLQIHDELLIETELDEKELVMDILKNKMEHAAQLTVPLVVDMHAGDTWFDAK